MLWTKKYFPRRINDIVGQDAAIFALKKFITTYKKQKHRAMIVYGSVGCGKTSVIYALANELNLEIMEMNASDLRNSEQINSVLGAASQQMSLFAKGKIILVEEVDGIAGKEDYGGVSALSELVDKSAWPIIMTANNPYEQKLSALRKKAEIVQFRELDIGNVCTILKRICEKEGIKYTEEMLKMIARRNGSDARGAINDLQMIGSRMFEKNAVEGLDERDRVENIMKALLKVFKSKEPEVVLGTFDNLEEDIDQCFLWVDENLPKEYLKAEELARAYDILSRADVLRGRISRQQHWRMLSYINELLTAGIAVSKDTKNACMVPYKQTTRLLKLWMAKQRNLKKKEIAAKIASRTHCSAREALQKSLPYLQVIFQFGKGGQIAKWLNLDKEQVAWLASNAPVRI